MTPAQKRALNLLAVPGAEARTQRSIRWRVMVGDEQIGTIHSETLGHLRIYGFVSWDRLDPLTVVQRITEDGRRAACKVAS